MRKNFETDGRKYFNSMRLVMKIAFLDARKQEKYTKIAYDDREKKST